DEYVRVLAIEGLAEDEDFRTSDRLVALLERDPKASVREAAAMSLRHFALLAEWGRLYQPSGRRLRSALLASVANPREESAVRRRPVEATGAFSGDDVREVIERAYAAGDPKRRGSA